jgi:hypothetical protein
VATRWADLPEENLDPGPTPAPVPWDDSLVKRTGLQTGLGLAALALGGTGLVVALLPGREVPGLAVCGAGLLLGGLGLLVGLFRHRQGMGLPTAGFLVSGVSLAVAVVWLLVLNHTLRATQRLEEEMAGLRAQLPRQAEGVKPPQNLGPAVAPGVPLENMQRMLQNDLERALATVHARNQQAREILQRLGQERRRGFQAPPAEVIPLQLVGGTVEVSNQLTRQDPGDVGRPNCPCKVYTIPLQGGRTYQIDMTSKQVDSYLRLEDAGGRELAHDDDGGGRPNARITFVCPRDGTYRIIATTAWGDEGIFTLTVQQK